MLCNFQSNRRTFQTFRWTHIRLSLIHICILEPALLRGLAGKLTREQLNEFQELLNRQNEELYLDQDAADDFFISLDNDCLLYTSRKLPWRQG